MQRWIHTLLLATAFMMSTVFLVGCQQESQEEVTKEQVEGPGYIEDATGEVVTFETPPKTIVSLMPSNTEILYALGAKKQVVGVTEFDDYPADVKKKEIVASMEWNVEKIIELKPELVLAHEMSLANAEGAIEQIRAAGIPLFVMPTAESIEETYKQIETVGRLLKKDKEAAKVIEQMIQKIDDVQLAIDEQLSKKVFVETSGEPDIYSPGKGTFIDEMLEMLKAYNIVEEDGWVMYSPEKIIEQNPDVIIAMYDYVPNVVESIQKRDGFEQVTAVQKGSVVQVDENLLSRTGPRLADGFEQLARAIYPEAFQNGQVEEEEELIEDAA